jgi:CDP-paratose 2-epimerase
MRLLITGGAGFVGSALGRHFQARGDDVVVLDNLKRRGSELNVEGLKAAGVEFVHGDVRNPGDLDNLDGTFDALIEASAEPSVLAGIGSSPRYVLDTNLVGAMNCLEFARKRCGSLIFLSSSRIYSIEPLLKLPFVEVGTRLDLTADTRMPGVSYTGVAESFPCNGPRSYYGASKLAAEMLCQEYGAESGLKVVINRCGVIAGPGQFGKTDQGVFTLWVARHHFGRGLRYTGFGGTGRQVRDLLHPVDLCELVTMQLAAWNRVNGRTFNVGGGRAGSVSLQEFTGYCREATGRSVPIEQVAETSTVDIPWYVTDHANITRALGWTPRKTPRDISADIASWVRANEAVLQRVIA